ncbi:MAG: hypothetical protein O7F76_03320 [Planctomycetota bacterium]|nr:hypothetical protein [Planctomycetota bacterium]
MSIVWIQMPGFNDNEKTAKRIAGTMMDPRVKHFYDPYPGHRAGKAFATGVVKRGPAWDIYFFYDKGATWTQGPPKPVDWWHQLGGGARSDPERFAAGVLAEKLHDSMHKVTGAECTGS